MDTAGHVSRRSAWIRLGALGVVLVVVAACTVAFGADALREAKDQVVDAGWQGLFAFIALYALATLLLVPGSASTATAGLVYGTVTGATVAVVGATIGATVAYLIARGVGRRPAESLLARRAAEIDAWLAERQLRSVIVLRLLPIVPFNLFNYAVGLSAVRSTPYVLGTIVGIAPGTVLVAGLGSSMRDPISWPFAVTALAVIATFVVSGLLARRLTER